MTEQYALKGMATTALFRPVRTTDPVTDDSRVVLRRLVPTDLHSMACRLGIPRARSTVEDRLHPCGVVGLSILGAANTGQLAAAGQRWHDAA